MQHNAGIKHKNLVAFLALSMYFLTGCACMLVGSSLPQLVALFEKPVAQVVLLGSAFAIGRFVIAYKSGRLVEQIGPMKVLMGGVFLILLFFIGIPLFPNYYAGLIFAFCGGMGMTAQDTVCPVLLSSVYKKNYAGSLSGGQALFGMGGFVTPFLIGVALSRNVNFFYAYYILAAFAIVMLICIPFAGLNFKADKGGTNEMVKPLYTKNRTATKIALLAFCVSYSATVNVMGLYISSFAESIGISPASSAFMLTVYNVGCVLGSIAFIFILKHVRELVVLLANNLIALIVLAIALIVNRASLYFVIFPIAGFFLGVLFSVIVTVATRIDYTRISVAGSHVAMASGFSDITTPIITGWLVVSFGIAFSFKYVIFMIIISIICVLVLKRNTYEKSEELINAYPE